MIKDDHFANVGFVCRAFLYSVRFLLMHPVDSGACQSFIESGRAGHFRYFLIFSITKK